MAKQVNKADPSRLDYYINTVMKLDQTLYRDRKGRIKLLVFSLTILFLGVATLIFFGLSKGIINSIILNRFMSIIYIYIGIYNLSLYIYYFSANKIAILQGYECSMENIRSKRKVTFWFTYFINIIWAMLSLIFYHVTVKLKLNFVIKYLHIIGCAWTVGLIYILVLKPFVLWINKWLVTNDTALLYCFLLSLILFINATVKVALKYTIKKDHKTGDWKREYQKTIEQYQLLGLYLLIGATAILKPLSSEFNETDRILSDALFFSTALIGLARTASNRWLNTQA